MVGVVVAAVVVIGDVASVNGVVVAGIGVVHVG